MQRHLWKQKKLQLEKSRSIVFTERLRIFLIISTGTDELSVLWIMSTLFRWQVEVRESGQEVKRRVKQVGTGVSVKGVEDV